MKLVRCDEAGLEETAAVLLSGGVAVIPTDTVYGLAAHPDFPAAVDRLYTIKGRELKKPIALLASDAEALERFGYSLAGESRRLAKLWPGALTLVVDPVNPNTQTPTHPNTAEGFRVPDHEWTRKLLRKCGGLLRVTSANMSGERPATDAEAALADVGLSADLVVDDGISPGGVASTVVKVSSAGELTILRQGALKI